ncbi:MAG: fused MFS/spermidine synthase [Phycisphaerae bacterium]|nr:fused MFS/spermidine synthase [Phycisphaerae bacterium]
MSKNRSFLSILVPAATVFFSSACIMVLELVASRLIAKHLGASLYTWTSVIGIVLAGITVGNYLGGRIADSFPARKALAVLLGISSVACVGIVVLNNLVGDWIWLWKLSWPVHVFTHVFLIFMLPSTLLGTVSPVVAKMALDRGLPTGRTVGDIYAFGAAGSIAGTFLAGFYLIAAMGTVAIIWSVGVVLLLMAILYWARLWALYIWAAIFLALMTMAMVPVRWAESTASSLALRQKPDPYVLYEDESQYSYIAVRRTSNTMDKRAFMLDKLMHSQIIMNDIFNLQYPYERIYAAVTHLLARDKGRISVLAIGGGGYVFPRYIEKIWPGSRIDVVEIDPRVTEAAMRAFGLKRDTPINTFTMDARNYVDELLEIRRTGGQVPRYDFIYEDAFNDYSVPCQLITKEFNDKIIQILADDGVYIINLIDTYDSGLFLGTFVKTLRQTFPHVYVVAEKGARLAMRDTFVVIASQQEINLENGLEKLMAEIGLWILNDSEIETLIEKGRGIILTDDYAPVENMLTPVVRRSALQSLFNKYMQRVLMLESQGRLDESLAIYKEIIEVDPAKSVMAYNSMGRILARQGKWQEVINAAQNAIEYNSKAEAKHSMSDMYFNIGLASKKLGRDKEGSEYIHKAIKGYHEDLVREPNSIKTIRDLGNALLEIGSFSEATEYLQKALDMNPLEVESNITLANAFLTQQRYDDAIALLKKAIASFSDVRNEAAVVELQRFLWYVEDKKNTNEK